MQDFQKTGMAYLELLQSNPFYDEIAGYWFEQWMLFYLKLYFSKYWWAGNMDNIIGSGLTLNGIKPLTTKPGQ